MHIGNVIQTAHRAIGYLREHPLSPVDIVSKKFNISARLMASCAIDTGDATTATKIARCTQDLPEIPYLRMEPKFLPYLRHTIELGVRYAMSAHVLEKLLQWMRSDMLTCTQTKTCMWCIACLANKISLPDADRKFVHGLCRLLQIRVARASCIIGTCALKKVCDPSTLIGARLATKNYNRTFS